MKTRMISAQIEKLDNAFALVDECLESVECSEKAEYHVRVSVEEIFTNIASYAYGPGGGEVEISCWTNGADGEKTIWICFKDRGIPYNPLAKPDPGLAVSIEERQIGGLGIYMVKNLMDYTDYRYEDGYNILTIGKNL